MHVRNIGESNPSVESFVFSEVTNHEVTDLRGEAPRTRASFWLKFVRFQEVFGTHFVQSRMHSSMMCTACFSGCLYKGPGVSASGSKGVSTTPHLQHPPSPSPSPHPLHHTPSPHPFTTAPPVDRQRPVKITLPQTSFAGGK